MWATPSVELGFWTKKECQLSPSIHLSLLPDTDAMWPAASCSCHHAFPAAMGCAWAKINLTSLSYFFFSLRCFVTATGKVANMTPRSGRILWLSLAIFCSATFPSYVFFSSAVSQGCSPRPGSSLVWRRSLVFSRIPYVPSDFACHRWVVAGRACACLLEYSQCTDAHHRAGHKKSELCRVNHMES